MHIPGNLTSHYMRILTSCVQESARTMSNNSSDASSNHGQSSTNSESSLRDPISDRKQVSNFDEQSYEFNQFLSYYENSSNGQSSSEVVMTPKSSMVEEHSASTLTALEDYPPIRCRLHKDKSSEEVIMTPKPSMVEEHGAATKTASEDVAEVRCRFSKQTSFHSSHICKWLESQPVQGLGSNISTILTSVTPSPSVVENDDGCSVRSYGQSNMDGSLASSESDSVASSSQGPLSQEYDGLESEANKGSIGPEAQTPVVVVGEQEEHESSAVTYYMTVRRFIAPYLPFESSVNFAPETSPVIII
jgi:hypothetical protein